MRACVWLEPVGCAGCGGLVVGCGVSLWFVEAVLELGAFFGGPGSERASGVIFGATSESAEIWAETWLEAIGVYRECRGFFWASGGGTRATGAPRGRFGGFGPVIGRALHRLRRSLRNAFQVGLLAFPSIWCIY